MKKEQNFENTTNKAQKPRTFTIKQLIWFILGVLISVNALIFLILGLINDYAPLAYSPFATPNDAMKTAMGGIDFKWFGVITLFLGTVIYSLALSFATKTQEREIEKAERRKQRRLFSFEEGEKVVANFNTSTSQSSVPLPPSEENKN